MKKLPKSIQNLICGKPYEKDNLGESHSSVYLFDDCVLKISRISQEAIREYEILLWLADKLPVPKVIYYEKTKKKTYLLMSRIDGKPSLTLPYEDAIVAACRGLKMLWNIDTSTFPYSNSKEYAIDFIKHNVDQYEEELKRYADEGTYQNSTFKNPKELCIWLEQNYPEHEKNVFSHGDYFLPNILVKNHDIVGFIDFGLAGLSPKERDIAQLMKSLNINYPTETNHNEMLMKYLNENIKWDLVHYFKLYDELI